MLVEGLQVGQQLARVKAIGQGIDHRHIGARRKTLELLVLEGAHGDDVDHAGDDARGVLYRFAAAQLRVTRREKHRAAAEMRHGRLEGNPRAGRRLLEDHAEHATGERGVGDPGATLALERLGAPQHGQKFIAGEIVQ